MGRIQPLVWGSKFSKFGDRWVLLEKKSEKGGDRQNKLLTGKGNVADWGEKFVVDQGGDKNPGGGSRSKSRGVAVSCITPRVEHRSLTLFTQRAIL